MAMRSLFPVLPIFTAQSSSASTSAAAASSNRLLIPPLPTASDLSDAAALDCLAVGNRKLLRDLSTFAIGGPCSFFLESTRPGHLLSAARLARARSLPLLVLGRGSNCLFSDRGFDGLVVLNRSSATATGNDGIEAVGFGRLRACSGYPFNRLGMQTAAKGWGGLEFAGGIPGTVGGAVFMNAGANGQETAEAVESVEVVTRGGEVRVLGREDVRFGYRWSSLQDMEDLAAIVAVTFRLRPAPAARDRQREFLDRRRRTQPISERSAGSVFRNPTDLGVTAGELIDITGLKGLKIGGAQVSQLHANFIVNTGGATANDVLSLIAFVKEKVDRVFGIELKEEIRYVPYNSS